MIYYTTLDLSQFKLFTSQSYTCDIKPYNNPGYNRSAWRCGIEGSRFTRFFVRNSVNLHSGNLVRSDGGAPSNVEPSRRPRKDILTSTERWTQEAIEWIEERTRLSENDGLAVQIRWRSYRKMTQCSKVFSLNSENILWCLENKFILLKFFLLYYPLKQCFSTGTHIS